MIQRCRYIVTGAFLLLIVFFGLNARPVAAASIGQRSVTQIHSKQAPTNGLATILVLIVSVGVVGLGTYMMRRDRRRMRDAQAAFAVNG